MKSFSRRTLLFTAAALALSYIYFFVFTLYTYPEGELLHQFRISWVFTESLRSMIDHLPTIFASAVIASFATISRNREELFFSSENLSDTVGKLIVLFLLFSLVYTALDIGLLPSLQQERHTQLYQSSLAGDYLKKAEHAREEGQLGEASRFYRNYLSIVEENPEIERELELLEAEISVQEGEEKEVPEETRPTTRKEEYRNLSAQELVRRGREALEEREDPFTAHFMAQIAMELDSGREDAKRLAAQAWDAIGSLEPDREEKRRYELYRKKVRGYTALQRDEPVEAYYIFRELIEENPEDPDVQEYLEESRLQAKEVTFFIDEARETETVPGTRTIVYKEPGTEETSIVYIGRMVRQGAHAWLHDVEIIRFTAEGELEEHLAAEYAKLVSKVNERGEEYSVFIFRGIDNRNPEASIGPTVSGKAAQRESAEAAETEETAEPRNVYRSTATLHELSLMSMHTDFLERLSLLDLFKLESTFEKYTLPESQIQVEALMRLLGPFIILILSLFSVGLGLRFRPRSGRVHPLLYLFLPAIPFFLLYVVLIIEYIHRLIFTILSRFTGFTPSIAVFLVLQALLLFLAVYFSVRYRET
ncbi:MAG: LptF/LptG family permease [Spirochaetaceae bacterium]